jgi:hypothetical protein
MSSPVHALPEQIVLTREEYRLQHAALEAGLEGPDDTDCQCEPSKERPSRSAEPPAARTRPTTDHVLRGGGRSATIQAENS